jgi:hypothetical protein
MVNDSETIARSADIAEWGEAPPQYSEIKRVLSVFFGRKLPVIGLVIIIVLILTAILAPLILAPIPLVGIP